MNRLVIGKAELKEQFQSDRKLGDVFRQLEKQVLATGEIICRFSVNGLPLSEDDEKKFSQFTMAEVESLEIDSQAPQILLLEVIGNWIDSLPGLIKKSDELSKAIRFEGIENHMAQFVDVVDSCQFLVESLSSLKVLCDDYKFVKAEAWQESEGLTSLAISEVLSSFEKKDFNLLADVLEYDLGHCLQNWLEALGDLRKHVVGGLR